MFQFCVYQFICIYALSFHFYYFNNDERGHSAFGLLLFNLIIGSFLFSTKTLSEICIPSNRILLILAFVLGGEVILFKLSAGLNFH
mmetsp:Transcript_17585/g.27193  ORF Transcript_17585/g.27193 Transcript_17585/m.27193 type:complete len:86 (-) Transcript_17585:569-826(-)